MTVGTVSAEDLHASMVDRLVADHVDKGLVMRPEVEAVLRVVPRHLFTPGVELEEAYRDDHAVITKRVGDEAVSSVSAAWLIAEMLGQAANAAGGLRGRRVLEIGSGGYNAALLRELTGPSGSVTTIDIDPDVTSRATVCLAAAGYDDVTVVCADAEQPVAGDASVDVIIVTAGAWDIPPAWISQLAGNGTLVVPLRTFGMTRSWALRRAGDRLVSHSQRLCGFVLVRGAGTREMRHVDLAAGVHLRLDEGQQADAAALSGLLSEPPAQAWAGVSLPPTTVLADLDMWLAAGPGSDAAQFAVLTAEQEAVDAGIVAPGWRFGSPATLGDGTLCYRSALRWSQDRMFDLGARAHGPDAVAAVGRLSGQMRAWADAGTPAPVLHVLPPQTPDGDLPAGTVLDKRHSRLVLTFTPAQEGQMS
jgi:protein-L-isoaspartate(D-aspartate) O-methyltransferase